MNKQRGEVLVVLLLFTLIVTVATAIHEIAIGHSPLGDEPIAQVQQQ